MTFHIIKTWLDKIRYYFCCCDCWKMDGAG